ncbi:MAG: lipoyl synthase [Deltaproteobacteria bacterium]|nr:lipoyl synthase [Deltaproteobacteria bacterium]
MNVQITTTAKKKPPWLKRRLPTGKGYENVRRLLDQSCLHTVCQEAKCPNLWECFSKGTATFMIMGARCTRNCRFCAVEHGALDPPETDEPERIAEAVQTLNLGYVVVTSVTRDDLPNGGAAHFAASIGSIRKVNPDTFVEVLIPDFEGSLDALELVLKAAPDVLNHNLETVKRLYPKVRPEAVYERSLELLQRAHHSSPYLPVKSGLMLGLGETRREIEQALQDLLDHGCSLLTLGQYLQPSKSHLPVVEYISPEIFAALGKQALAMGFKQVASGPFVRSSYHARELFSGMEV